MSSDVQRFRRNLSQRSRTFVNDWPRYSRNFQTFRAWKFHTVPQEYGKDIVFYSQDAIGDWILNASSVGIAKITGAAEGEDSARNVFNQVEQALDTAFIKKVHY